MSPSVGDLEPPPTASPMELRAIIRRLLECLAIALHLRPPPRTLTAVISIVRVTHK